MSNATIIGSASEFNGVTTFKSQPIITSTILANTDSSTNIATTAWSNAFWTYVKTQANTWSGAQTFTTTTTDTLTAPTITSNMTIGSNLNGGSVTIGATSTTTINGVTAINIGTSETQTGNIAIGTNNSVLSGTNQIFIGASNKTTNISGSAINIGNTGLSATGVVNIASGTNVAGSEMFLGSTTLSKCYIRGGDVNINHTTGANIYMGSTTGGGTNIIGNVTLGADALINPTAQSSNITIGTANSAFRLYTPINPLHGYGYGIEKIGGRYENGGSGGVPVTVYGDGNWRNYLYANNVHPGVYLFQYWANPGGMTYTNVNQRIHLSPNPFTGVSNVINDMLVISQSYINPAPNLYNTALGQVALPFTIVVDSSRPHVCFAMLCNTNFNALTYHGLTLTRLA